MPLVKIEMWAGRTPEQKEKIIQNVTKAVCDAVGCPKEAVWVVIEDVPKENWGMSGEQCSKKK
ncbi:MAG: 2-hydroxymuconate tautomerase [bacterium]